jgi:hypothetical protein
MRNTYNASSVTPYNPAETLGDVTPSTPQAVPPKKQKCGGFGQIFLAIIAIAVTVMLPGGGIIGGAINGAIGSIVSQTVGVAIGIQDKFSWKAVAMAAITAGVDSGMSNAFKNIGSATMQAVARSAASSAISQGINVALGLQDRFSWAAVAASAVGAGVGHKVGNSAMLSKASGQVVKAAVSTTTMLTNAATRSLIDGSDFGDNVLSALPSVLGSMIFDGLVSLIPEASEENFTQSAGIIGTTMTDAGPSYGGARGAPKASAKYVVTNPKRTLLGRIINRLDNHAYELTTKGGDIVQQGINIGNNAISPRISGPRADGTYSPRDIYLINAKLHASISALSTLDAITLFGKNGTVGGAAYDAFQNRSALGGLGVAIEVVPLLRAVPSAQSLGGMGAKAAFSVPARALDIIPEGPLLSITNAPTINVTGPRGISGPSPFAGADTSFTIAGGVNFQVAVPTARVESAAGRGAVSPLEVGAYGKQSRRSIGDDLTPDHVPSFAAIRTHVESQLGRPLSAAEARQLRNETSTIMIDTDIHQQVSRTYGGRNSGTQIGADASDLGNAARLDEAAYSQALRDRGYSQRQINDAFTKLHEVNRAKGYYQ